MMASYSATSAGSGAGASSSASTGSPVTSAAASAWICAKSAELSGSLTVPSPEARAEGLASKRSASAERLGSGVVVEDDVLTLEDGPPPPVEPESEEEAGFGLPEGPVAPVPLEVEDEAGAPPVGPEELLGLLVLELTLPPVEPLLVLLMAIPEEVSRSLPLTSYRKY